MLELRSMANVAQTYALDVALFILVPARPPLIPCCSEQRATDVSVEKCRKRYAIFKQHYTATLRLKQFFPFHLIDAMGTLAETQEAITKELRCETCRGGRHAGLGSSMMRVWLCTCA